VLPCHDRITGKAREHHLRQGRSIVKKLTIVAVLIAGVAIAGYLGYSLRNRRTPQAFFDTGKKYFDQERYTEATISFLNAVQKDPRNRDARYFLALTYTKQGELSHAVSELRSLLEIYPDDTEANIELGSIYFTGARSDAQFVRQAQELAQKVLSKDPKNVKALILAGNTAANLQDFTRSVDFLEKAASLDPKSPAPLISLGIAYALQKNYTEAEKSFLKARETDPKDKNAFVSLAAYYRATAESVKAEAVLKQAVSMYPGDKALYPQLATLYAQEGRFEDVERVFRDAQAGDADDPAPTLALAGLNRALNRPEDAEKLLLDSKSKFPNSLDFSINLAMSLIKEHPVEAQKEIDQIIKTAPKSPIGYVLLGELQYRNGQFDAAEETLGKEPALSSQFAEPQYLLGKMAMRKGQMDQALDHFQKSIAKSSVYSPARMALAQTFMAKGQLPDARLELRKALELETMNINARLLAAQLDILEKKFPDAERELLELAQEQPNNPPIQRQLALFYDTQGKSEEALKGYLRALELDPISEQNFRNLITFYLRARQMDRALEKLNSVPDEQKRAFQYELLGITALQTGNLRDAENAYKKALEKDPNRTNTAMLLATLYIQTGRTDEGLKSLDELEKKNPRNSTVYSLKGDIFQSQGKAKEAAQNYAKALEIDPNDDAVANNLAYLYAEDNRDLQSALGWAQNARKRHPEDARAADTLGWIYYKLGNYVLAKDQALFAISKDSNNGLFQYHLGLIYKATNKTSDAEVALRKAIDSPNDFKDKRLADAALKDLRSKARP
jgi:tetratricopeptide (TPR) repeat protein